MTYENTLSPEQVVQENVDYYNARDIDGFMTAFSEDIALYNFSELLPSLVGREQVREFYAELFQLSPQLYSTIIKRITFDNKVIDHESITGRKGSSDIIELVLIYEVKKDKICKITVMK